MKALVTGISGQIGWYLAEVLREEGWQVFGLVPPQAGVHLPAGSEAAYVARELPYVEQVLGDLQDASSVAKALREVRPDVVFALGALSQPRLAHRVPNLMLDVNGLGMVRLLTAVRESVPPCRVVHASSDEVYGRGEGPQVAPTSWYGFTKAVAHLAVMQARADGLWASNAVLYNAISPRQTTGLVPYVVEAVDRIHRGHRLPLELDTMDLYRDWAFAGDVARALVVLSQVDDAGDVPVGSGVTRPVTELLHHAFIARSLVWQDWVRVKETGASPDSGRQKRADVWPLYVKYGWAPTIQFPDLIRWLVDAWPWGGNGWPEGWTFSPGRAVDPEQVRQAFRPKITDG